MSLNHAVFSKLMEGVNNTSERSGPPERTYRCHESQLRHLIWRMPRCDGPAKLSARPVSDGDLRAVRLAGLGSFCPPSTPGPITMSATRPPLPPFTAATAAQKARAAEDAWNTRVPARVADAYTPDSRWRNRAEFL